MPGTCLRYGHSGEAARLVEVDDPQQTLGSSSPNIEVNLSNLCGVAACYIENK